MNAAHDYLATRDREGDVRRAARWIAAGRKAFWAFYPPRTKRQQRFWEYAGGMKNFGEFTFDTPRGEARTLLAYHQSVMIEGSALVETNLAAFRAKKRT